jgi:hypothetical protein
MRNNNLDEKILSTNGSIGALGLPDRERSRALSALAKADALVGAFLSVTAFFIRRQRRPTGAPKPEISLIRTKV